MQRGIVATTLERLAAGGYARFAPGNGSRIELTEHARTWIERIWAPLRADGNRLLEVYPVQQLTILAGFMRQACEILESQTRQLRTWLETPSSPARRSHLRGGLSPAALRRVQLFVEANLGRTIHLHDLAARAALSPYHFARAFKTSAGMTPRTYVEHRRIEQAKQLLTESTQSLAQVAMDVGLRHAKPAHVDLQAQDGIHARRVPSRASVVAPARHELFLAAEHDADVKSKEV